MSATGSTAALPAAPGTLPLAGITIVELSDNASAPFGGFALAALGATVWKVERPGKGDSARGWGPSTWNGSASGFHALNRGKHSICIDIKDAGQLAQLHRLIIDHADVFLHNLRPGSCAHYGLDADSLRARKPGLIHCEVGAFGHIGPMKTDPGYDPLMQAFSGIMNITGEAGQPPVRAGVSLVDFGTGLWATVGILAALYRRSTTGAGCSVNGSLLETAIAWNAIGIANYITDGEPGGRHGSGIAFIVPHRTYGTADGHLAVSCGNDPLFRKLCVALDHPAWADDPRFATNAARLEHRDEIDGRIQHALARRSRDHWVDVLGRHGIACAPVQTTGELVQHGQTQALDIIGSVAGELPMVGLPLSFDGARPAPLPMIDELGRSNDAMLRLLEGR